MFIHNDTKWSVKCVQSVFWRWKFSIYGNLTRLTFLFIITFFANKTDCKKLPRYQIFAFCVCVWEWKKVCKSFNVCFEISTDGTDLTLFTVRQCCLGEILCVVLVFLMSCKKLDIGIFIISMSSFRIAMEIWQYRVHSSLLNVEYFSFKLNEWR